MDSHSPFCNILLDTCMSFLGLSSNLIGLLGESVLKGDFLLVLLGESVLKGDWLLVLSKSSTSLLSPCVLSLVNNLSPNFFSMLIYQSSIKLANN